MDKQEDNSHKSTGMSWYNIKDAVNKAVINPASSGKSYSITLHTVNDIENCIDFIREYRRLENMLFVAAKDFLENTFASEPIHKVNSIVEKWKYKKKDFAAFYLNIDVPYRIKLYNSFGIEDYSDLEYIDKIKENPIAALFENQSLTYNRLHNLIVFFNNHGITESPTEYLKLKNIPKFSGRSFDPKDPTFGNSKNWGNYILSLPLEEQSRVIGLILNNYQTERYVI